MNRSPVSVRPATPTNIMMPDDLHQLMQILRQARSQFEGAHVSLSRLYVEAVEQYLNAKAQRDLLEMWEEAKRGKKAK